MKTEIKMPLEEVMKVIRSKNKGMKSTNGGKCMYRSNDNNCCLVGAFIPDDKYHYSIEGDKAEDVIEINNLEKYMPFDIGTMEKLQSFHDYGLPSVVKGEDFYNSVEQYLIENVYGE